METKELNWEEGLNVDLAMAELMGWKRKQYPKTNKHPVPYYFIDVDNEMDGGIFRCEPHRIESSMFYYRYSWNKFRPSLDIADSFMVVDRMLEMEFVVGFHLEELPGSRSETDASFQFTKGKKGSYLIWESAETRQLAICKSAYKTRERIMKWARK